MSGNQDRGRSKGKGPAVQHTVAGPSTGEASTSSQLSDGSETNDGLDAALRDIETMTKEANLQTLPEPDAGPDLWASYSLSDMMTRDPSVKSSSSNRRAISDRSSSGSRDASSNRFRSARFARDLSVGSNGEPRNKYAKWQETNLKRSMPMAPPYVLKSETDDQQSCRAPIARVRTGEEKDELIRLLTMLPTELHIYILELLPAWNTVQLSFVSRGLYWLVRDLEDRVATAIINPYLARFHRYMGSFDYHGKPFIQALQHWNMAKGISLEDATLNGTTFAKFWLAQNSDIDIELIKHKPEECLNDLDELAKRLTNLHLVRHNPHKEQIDVTYLATSDDFTHWEQKTGGLTQFPTQFHREKLQAIEKIKTDKKYLSGRIWAADVSAEWDPTGTTIVHHKPYENSHIGNVTPCGRFENESPDNIKIMDQNTRTFEETLGLPPLIDKFGIDRCFAYCTLEPDIRKLTKDICDHTRFERAFGHFLVEYLPLAKAHIIENLTLY